MITRPLNIRHWDILFLFSYGPRDLGEIIDALLWADAPDSIIRRVEENVSAGRPDEGFCYSDPSLRRSVAAIGKTSTGPEFLDTTVHEVAHLAQGIAREDGIDPYGEEIAYLTGDITRGVSDIVCEMSCPHCRDSQ